MGGRPVRAAIHTYLFLWTGSERASHAARNNVNCARSLEDMCGRYLITTVPQAMRELLEYLEQPNFPPRYNVAPTQPVPIVRLWEGRRQFALVRWGLIPAWAKDPKTFSLMINARGDTAAEKPAFRYAMVRRRCLFPADGFYEWKAEGNGKRPYAILPAHGGPIAFAGVWESWIGPNGEELETAAILTTDANETLRPIHHRMPVVIAPEAFETWLDCRNVSVPEASALLQPAPDDFFRAYEVSPAVNRHANDSPDLLLPAKDVPPEPAPERKPRVKVKADSGQGSLF
jgi:putative SOS response-associated peptidase YedK